MARLISDPSAWNTKSSGKRTIAVLLYTYARANEFRSDAGPALDRRIAWVCLSHERPMVTMRVVRHDRHELVLAECQTAVIPARGEVIQLDTTDRDR